jgi:hypothetical protein
MGTQRGFNSNYCHGQWKVGLQNYSTICHHGVKLGIVCCTEPWKRPCTVYIVHHRTVSNTNNENIQCTSVSNSCIYWLTTIDCIDKRQTGPLVREGASQRQDSNFEKKKKISLISQVPERAQHQDILTRRPSVAMWLWLWLDFMA